jgi:peptidoglycan hydrolase FlgJ
VDFKINEPPPPIAIRGNSTLSATPVDERKKLKDVSQDFEAVLLQQLLETMDKTIDRSDGLFEEGQAGDTFRGMHYEQLAQQLTHPTSGFSPLGLAQQLYSQQEAQLSKIVKTPTTTP